MNVEDIRTRPAIEGLAFVAECSVDDCLRHGAQWTLRRLLERQRAIPTIMVVMRLASSSLSFGKMVAGLATETFVDALGAAIDRRDEEAAIALLMALSNRTQESEALAKGLLDAFSEKPT